MHQHIFVAERNSAHAIFKGKIPSRHGLLHIEKNVIAKHAVEDQARRAQ